jgi:hypothetical protein
MYKINVIIFLLLFLVASKNYGQTCTDGSKRLIENFSELSDVHSFKLEYFAEKETLYFSIFQNGTQERGFRLLVKDIHPEGVFVIEDKIRVLSINNGYMFVEENFKNGHRLSHNTNYVDVTDLIDLSKAQHFASLLKDFVKSKIEKPKTKEEEIKVYMSPKKN